MKNFINCEVLGSIASCDVPQYSLFIMYMLALQNVVILFPQQISRRRRVIYQDIFSKNILFHHIKFKMWNAFFQLLNKKLVKIKEQSFLKLVHTPCRNIKRFRQMRQFQKILTRISISFIMAVYEIFCFFIFQVKLRNQEIVYQHKITDKYYKIGRSELRWDI